MIEGEGALCYGKRRKEGRREGERERRLIKHSADGNALWGRGYITLPALLAWIEYVRGSADIKHGYDAAWLPPCMPSCSWHVF